MRSGRLLPWTPTLPQTQPGPQGGQDQQGLPSPGPSLGCTQMRAQPGRGGTGADGKGTSPQGPAGSDTPRAIAHGHHLTPSVSHEHVARAGACNATSLLGTQVPAAALAIQLPDDGREACPHVADPPGSELRTRSSDCCGHLGNERTAGSSASHAGRMGLAPALNAVSCAGVHTRTHTRAHAHARGLQEGTAGTGGLQDLLPGPSEKLLCVAHPVPGPRKHHGRRT